MGRKPKAAWRCALCSTYASDETPRSTHKRALCEDCYSYLAPAGLAWCSRGGHRAVWRHNKISDPFNPTAKPPELVAQLIELFSNPGDLILDPFAGVGTTLLQARALGRVAVGIEQDESQCAEIVRRLRPTFGEPVRRRTKVAPLDLPMFQEAA